MSKSVTAERYTVVAIILHWMIALGIITLITMGLVMDHLHISQMRVFQLYQLHKSIGIVVLFLVLIRILWRLTHNPPALPKDMLAWERKAAEITHSVLYFLQLIIPLSGWALVSVSILGIPTVLFGVVSWPDLPYLSTLSNKEVWEGFLKVVHHWLAWGLLAIIVMHIAAALKHQFVEKDHILRRMLPLKNSKG